MKKIDKLTPEQIARFPEFVKKWTDIGLCTKPADRPRAERATASIRMKASGRSLTEREAMSDGMILVNARKAEVLKVFYSLFTTLIDSQHGPEPMLNCLGSCAS